MSPRRPRRRARRRSQSPPVLLLVAVAVTVALVVGGLLRVSSQSGPYTADTNRSLAAQDAVVAEQSNATAASVRTLVAGMPQQTRQGLQAGLDNAAQQAADESSRAALAAGAAPAGSVAETLSTAFAERAQAVDELRATIDNFLGMTPVPPAGTANQAAAVRAPATLLTATAAANRLTAVGSLLSHSDVLYRSARRQLSAAPGHARLPRSVWVTNPRPWGADAVASQVDLLSTSPTLISSHYLVLRSVSLDPPALPAPPGQPAGTSTLSPTGQIGVDVVLANQGSVNEPRGTVRYTLTNQNTGAGSTQTRSAPVAVGATVNLPRVTFAVRPGTFYVLTVSVVLSADQSVTAGTAVQRTLQVAPGT